MTAVEGGGTEEGADEDEHWAEEARRSGVDLVRDLHGWPRGGNADPSLQERRMSVADGILSDWKSFVDWDYELTLRDTEKRERVKLVDVLPDGRVEVVEMETGKRRTLVTDYFL